MPNVRVKVYDSQNGTWMFDNQVDVRTMEDVKSLIGYNPNSRYTDSVTRTDPFTDPNKLVTGDVTIFCAPAKSKAGRIIFKPFNHS